ncbi:MAG: PAS domain-containing protein [Campylobacterales bacterium]|nr:PAS domain-containing protein [Campylobacterales bacterium]
MNNNLIVVGIGSSAGGLEALQTMLMNLPEIQNCAYIIAHHLSPTHKSMMVNLLARTTNLPVIEITSGIIIKAKTIYMTPENTDVYVKGNKIYLKTIEHSFGPRPSINYLFSSLAQSYNEKAMGIVLSGTGSDGAYGIRTIKAEGGITIAQSPATAKYDGMPLSAINTGKVDLVVPIEKIGSEIESIVSSLDKRIELSLNDRLLQQIYRIIFDQHGVDFSLYKKNTITRRIERRLSALKIDSLQEYLKILEDSETEVSILYHDILIGVTAFFRDQEAFEKLREQITAIVAKKEQGEEIRFWSIGCSTGEEPYSIAIILSEILKDKISKYKIKIFATDIDSEALKIARSGLYAETALVNVDKDILKTYFNVQKNQFEVKKELRELVIFSKHNIVSDAPFLRLDLIVCRNMLIYFSNTLQSKFFPIIHYALKDNGILFLGKSESIGQHIDLFSLIDKNAKIFKSQFTGIKELPKLYNYSYNHEKLLYDDEPRSIKTKNEVEYLEDIISQAVRETVLKNCVAINSSNDILYIKGDIPYLRPKEGKISNNIFKLLNDDLSLDLRSELNKASKDKKVKLTPFRSINIFDDIMRYVRIIITPVKDEKSDDWIYILFFQSEESQNIKGHIISESDDSEAIEKLSLELDNTKSHLQNVIEELESSYEEMQSSNEELQSSNEELETTNEELQSTNEELQTAYSELRVLYEDKEKRTKQLEELTEKLNQKTKEYREQKELTEGILDTAPIAITMVNKTGRIIYANNFAQKLFELSKKDIINRVYNSQEWKIKSFDGKDLDNEDLPFSIIKRTYEPIYNIKHTIETDSKRIYLSVSGSPQFDFEGQFQGAVFCIENLTDNLNLLDDVSYYKNNLSLEMENKIRNRESNLLEISIFDIVGSIRNTLSDLSLLVNTIPSQDQQIQNIIKLSNETFEQISKFLDDKIEFYTKNINYEKNSINKSILSFIENFDNLIKAHNIEFHINLDPSIDKIVQTKEICNSLYLMLSFIIGFVNNHKLKKCDIEISNDYVITHYILTFEIKFNEDLTLNENELKQEIEQLKEELEIEVYLEKGIFVKMKF